VAANLANALRRRLAWLALLAAPSKELWEGMIRGVQRIEKCNYTTAVNKCLATDEGRAVFAGVRRAEQIASGVFFHIDLECLDRAEAHLDGHRDIHKRNARSKFEQMTEELMDKRRLSKSKAMDYVRSTPDGLAAWQEFKSKPGAVHLPQGESEDDGSRVPYVPTTSGRVDPPRVSQWDSPHSGSRYSPPTGTPWRANEAPAIKRWLDLVKRAECDYGFSRERTIEILKVLSHGKAAFDAAVAEASAL
jgi:hypothetical protein